MWAHNLGKGILMEYTIQKLAKLAGVTTRTLRYYDQIGLLHPDRVNSAGYRIYGDKQVDRLQQILFYRDLGLGLEEIKDILLSPEFDHLAALRSHRLKLIEKQQQIEQLIKTVDITIWAKERGIFMDNQDKFTGFKQKLVQENEHQYGKEIREKYSEDTVNASNNKLMGLSRQEYNRMQALNQAIQDALDEAFPTGDPSCQVAQKAAQMHKEWLAFTWTSYSKEAHAGLANMYVEDDRFAQYYDRGQKGKAQFLRDAILLYLESVH